MRIIGLAIAAVTAAAIVSLVAVWYTTPAAALSPEQAALAKLYERGVKAAAPACSSKGAKVITLLGKVDGQAVTFVGCVEP